MSNRKTYLTIAFFVIVMFYIITHAAVWNEVAVGNLPKAYTFFSLADFVVAGYGLYLIYSRFIKDKE